MADALTLAPSCLRFMGQLRHPEVFRFCAIPQVMAVASLDKVANNADLFTGVVKIRKGQALKLMAGCGTMQVLAVCCVRCCRCTAWVRAVRS